MDTNVAIVSGRLGREPVMRFTPNGQAVTNFSIGNDRHYTNGTGEQITETLWANIEVWGKAAEACNKFLIKGQKVTVTGRIKPTRKYTREDGTAGYSGVEVSAQNVEFGEKPRGAQRSEEEPAMVESEEEITF